MSGAMATSAPDGPTSQQMKVHCLAKSDKSLTSKGHYVWLR